MQWKDLIAYFIYQCAHLTEFGLIFLDPRASSSNCTWSMGKSVIYSDGSKAWVMRSLFCIFIVILAFSISVAVLVYCLMRILKDLTNNNIIYLRPSVLTHTEYVRTLFYSKFNLNLLSVHFNSVTRQMQNVSGAIMAGWSSKFVKTVENEYARQ